MEKSPLLSADGPSRRKVLGVAGLALCGAAALAGAAGSLASTSRPTALAVGDSGNFKLPPYPQENFSWKNEAPGNPPCDTNGCAFRDEVFKVDNWDQLCIQHCGDIDAMLKAVNQRQMQGVMLAQGGRMQALTGMRTADGDQLRSAGVNTDAWGELSEHEMPEQSEQAEEDHKDDNVVVRGWNNFWDSGRRLRREGVNVDTAPSMGGGQPRPTDGEVLVRNGLVVSSWPWDGHSRREASPEGHLDGVHVSGWDGEAKAW